MTPRTVRRALAAAALAAATPASTLAQIIVVNLHESTSGVAIAGAVVRLLRQDQTESGAC